MCSNASSLRKTQFRHSGVLGLFDKVQYDIPYPTFFGDLFIVAGDDLVTSGVLLAEK
jgi:hypothetical protein